jgi:hypothetical protein
MQKEPSSAHSASIGQHAECENDRWHHAAERSQTRIPLKRTRRGMRHANARAHTRRNKLARIVGNRHLHALCVDAALRHGEGLKDE